MAEAVWVDLTQIATEFFWRTVLEELHELVRINVAELQWHIVVCVLVWLLLLLVKHELLVLLRCNVLRSVLLLVDRIWKQHSLVCHLHAHASIHHGTAVLIRVLLLHHIGHSHLRLLVLLLIELLQHD